MKCVSRAQRSTSISAFTRVFTRYGDALQTRDRYEFQHLERSRISGAPFATLTLHRVRDKQESRTT